MSYNIQRTTFKVANFISWYKTNGLVLNPNFSFFDNEDSIILDSPTYADWHGVLIPCVLKQK